jgi:phage-related minor tail protein
MNEQDNAAKAAGDTLEQALLKATQSVERELARIVKTGEDDLDRLARKIAETLAQLALDGALGGLDGGGAREAGTTGGASSFNQIATALAKAARRGGRFT